MSAGRILVIEDNPADVFLIREALREQHVDARVDVVDHGDRARRLIEEHPASASGCPDLVLLDLNLPGLDGLALLELMRDRNWCARTPVVVFTSSESRLDYERAMLLGVKRFVHKGSGYEAFVQVGHVIKQILDPSTPP
ncbi:MAG TPA: response regulator [Bryobacteraceae bacterium]|nr:response regulator [Bryobacteraceae bacterium]